MIEQPDLALCMVDKIDPPSPLFTIAFKISPSQSPFSRTSQGDSEFDSLSTLLLTVVPRQREREERTTRRQRVTMACKNPAAQDAVSLSSYDVRWAR